MEEKIKKMDESLKNRATTAMLSEMRKDLEKKIADLQEMIDTKSWERGDEINKLREEIKEIEGKIQEMKKSSMSLQDDISLLRKYFLKYEKIQKRLKNMEEVMGIEEDINVNKIPPSILRLVYQYTLNDAIDMLRKYVGPSESERIMKYVLQDVRTRTSGTELFKLVNGKIEARDIEKAIKKKLISPKQIHLTYIEIINKIREYIPGFVPKNFASLLRTKGQEYAIETSTENRIRIEMLERSIENMRSEMAYQENIIREDISEIKRMIEMDIQNTANSLSERISKVEEMVSGLHDEMERIADTIKHMFPYISSLRSQIYSKIMEDIPAEGIPLENLEYPAEIINDFLNEEINRGDVILQDNVVYSTEKIKNRILEALGERSLSFSNLRKELGYDKEILVTVLEWMKKEGTIEEKKYGKGKKYKRR